MFGLFFFFNNDNLHCFRTRFAYFTSFREFEDFFFCNNPLLLILPSLLLKFYATYLISIISFYEFYFPILLPTDMSNLQAIIRNLVLIFHKFLFFFLSINLFVISSFIY